MGRLNPKKSADTKRAAAEPSTTADRRHARHDQRAPRVGPRSSPREGVLDRQSKQSPAPDRDRAPASRKRDQNHITASGLGEREDRGRVARGSSPAPRPGAKKQAFESRAGRTPKKNAVSNPGRRR